MQSLSEALGRNCARSALITVIACGTVLPLACCLVIAPLAWVMNDSQASIWYLVIPLVLFLLILFGGSLLFGWLVLNRRNKKLDEVFTPLGLQGSTFGLLSRRYTGAIGGRAVTLTLSRGPLLQLRLATPLQTRLGITGQHFDTHLLAGLLGQQALQLDTPGLEGLQVFAADQAWARRLLEEPVARGLLQRLVLEEGWFTRRQVLIDPGVITLLYSGSRGMLDFNYNITPDEGRRWLADLQAFARLAENQPGPALALPVAASEPASPPEPGAPAGPAAALPLPPNALSAPKGRLVIAGVLLFIFLPGLLVILGGLVFVALLLAGGGSP